MTPPDTAISLVPATRRPARTSRRSSGRAARRPCASASYKLQPRESFSNFPAEERAHRLRMQTECGNPSSETTSGLVAYLDGEAVGWCAVEPRTVYNGNASR